jgi:hypothetical protein
MAAADLTVASRTQGVTVAHVTNSLAQIELWIGAVRAALTGLEPDMPLPGSGMQPLFASPNRVKKDCPPPTPKKKKTTKKKK